MSSRRGVSGGRSPSQTRTPKPRPTGFPVEHLHLVAKNEELEVPVPLIPSGGDEAKDAAQEEVEKGEQHRRILRSGRSRRESEFSTPTGSRRCCEPCPSPSTERGVTVGGPTVGVAIRERRNRDRRTPGSHPSHCRSRAAETARTPSKARMDNRSRYGALSWR